MNEETHIKLRIESTPIFHIPGMMSYIEHMYKADKKTALQLGNDMFSGIVKVPALHDILSGNRQPLFVPENVGDNSLTYVFSKEELNVDVLAELQEANNS